MTKLTRVGSVVIPFIIAMLLGAALHATLRPSAQYAECGMCGAHVSEWWYVQGADGTPCEVCEHCYLMCLE